ncbi:MAG TPA: hypothetical protein VEL76_02475 [Gemmataceae bacterium]|nr:hypothetical protein [Gemmataceae bacterium]
MQALLTYDEILQQRWADDGGACPDSDDENLGFSLNRNQAPGPFRGGQAVYETLAAHQQTERDWSLHGVLVELHRWAEIFATEFRLQLPPVAFCVGPTRRNCYGYFRPGHNQFGMRREILIRDTHVTCQIAKREFWPILGTLLHELLHAWQDQNGLPGLNNYHNAQFRGKAAEYGLIVDARGYTQFPPGGPFFAVLRKHGMPVPAIPSPIVRERGRSRLKKWSCGCTNVRVAVAHFRALCLNCNRPFAPADFDV